MASLNLHGGVDINGQPFDVEAAIKGLDASVIALQEAWTPADGPDPVAIAAEALGAQMLRLPLRTIDGRSGPGATGMTVLSTVPVTDYAELDLGQLRGDVVRRHAQIFTIELPDRSGLRLISTHLTHRLVSPIQLVRLIRHISGRKLPTVIAGDLNMPRLFASTAPGYTPAVRGRTWPAGLPTVQLDHILISRGIERLDGRVLAATGSDHLPVRALLRLAPPGRPQPSAPGE